MNCRFCLLAIIFVSLLTSCASFGKNESESAETEEVVFDDGYKTKAEAEVIFNDLEFKETEGVSTTSSEIPQEINKVASDNSKISITFDRYGNKTEKRVFNYNPRLSFVIMRTSAHGEKQIFVYAPSGEVKSLPENMLDKVLTASADEIANSAGIQQPQTQVSISVQNNPLPSSIPLRPMPSNNFPIQNQSTKPVEKEGKSPEAQQLPSQNKETIPEAESNLLQ